MDLRIGDAERDAATARLGDHFAAGRLDHDEFDERLDAIWSARSRADLDQLFLDLPPMPAPTRARPAPVARRGIPRALPILVIVVLVGVAVFEAVPWVLVIAAVWLLFIRPRHRHAHGCRSGRHPGRRHGELGSSR